MLSAQEQTSVPAESSVLSTAPTVSDSLQRAAVREFALLAREHTATEYQRACHT